MQKKYSKYTEHFGHIAFFPSVYSMWLKTLRTRFIKGTAFVLPTNYNPARRRTRENVKTRERSQIRSIHNSHLYSHATFLHHFHFVSLSIVTFTPIVVSTGSLESGTRLFLRSARLMLDLLSGLTTHSPSGLVELVRKSSRVNVLG